MVEEIAGILFAGEEVVVAVNVVGEETAVHGVAVHKEEFLAVFLGEVVAAVEAVEE